jgi:hypothetical protein
MNSYLQYGQILITPFISSRVLHKHLEKVYNTASLKPLHKTGSLSSGCKVTVPTFDVENMLLSMLINDQMMTSPKKIPNHPTT